MSRDIMKFYSFKKCIRFESIGVKGHQGIYRLRGEGDV